MMSQVYFYNIHFPRKKPATITFSCSFFCLFFRFHCSDIWYPMPVMPPRSSSSRSWRSSMLWRARNWKHWMGKWPQTVNVHLLLLLDKTSTMLTVKRRFVRVWDMEDTHLTADLLWHIWCDVLGAQPSPSHLSCVKLKKWLIRYDFLFSWSMGSQSCAVPSWKRSSGLNVAYWPTRLLHDWPLPFSQLSSVQWTVLCLCFVSVSGNVL